MGWLRSASRNRLSCAAYCPPASPAGYHKRIAPVLQISVHHDLNAPAELIWELLADFANIERWWPTDDPAVQIDRVELEGEGIGLIRHIYNLGFADPVSERLDAQDPANMSYQLSIVGRRPAGITAYQAHGRIEPLAADRCRLHYRGEFTTQPGRGHEAEAFLRGAYALMFRGLEQSAERMRSPV